VGVEGIRGSVGHEPLARTGVLGCGTSGDDSLQDRKKDLQNPGQASAIMGVCGNNAEKSGTKQKDHDPLDDTYRGRSDYANVLRSVCVAIGIQV
jgi:hypothetical protein